MVGKKRAGGWDRPLTPSINLLDAPVARLATLRDAARLISEHFDTMSGGVDEAVKLLLKAAETGEPVDIDAATVQVKRLLRFRQWL